MNPPDEMDTAGSEAHLRERARLVKEGAIKLISEQCPTEDNDFECLTSKHSRLRWEPGFLAVVAILNPKRSVEDILTTWAQGTDQLFKATEGLNKSDPFGRFLHLIIQACIPYIRSAAATAPSQQYYQLQRKLSYEILLAMKTKDKISDTDHMEEVTNALNALNVSGNRESDVSMGTD